MNIRLEEGEQTVTAYITFETVNAANTSLLLANAMIADRAIQVVMDPAAVAAAPQGEFPAYPNAQEDEEAGASLMGGQTRAEPNAATKAIAQLLATGAKLSDTAVAEARALDEKWQVSNKVSSGIDEVKGALSDFSERIGLTQKASDTYQAISTKATETGLPEKASQAATATEGFFSNLARQASSAIQSVAQSGAQWAEENIPGAVAKLREAGDAMGQQAEAIRVEAHQIYPGPEGAQQDAAPQDPSMVPEEEHQAPADAAAAPAPASTAPAVDANGTPSIL